MAIFNGTAGNDNLSGGNSNDTLNGNSGNDILDGGAGIDTLNGDDGDDTLRVRTGDIAYGGTGNDILVIYEDGPAILDGGTGTDILEANSDDISGATLTGIETLRAYYAGLTAAQLDAFTLVSGISGTYTFGSIYLTLGGTADIDLDNAILTGSFTLTGSSQADIITFNAADTTPITANMGGGNDVVTGGIGNDRLNGEGGNDTLNGRAGNDILDGGLGIDTLNGDDGDDTLIVGTGDRAYGGNGNDTFNIQFYSDPAVLDGGAGVDILSSGYGGDISSAILTGIETLWASYISMTAAQLDTFTLVQGSNGTSTSGDLVLTAGGTADVDLDNATLTGGFRLNGSIQADIITFQAADVTPITAYMGGGHDVITAGIGNDRLNGEGGNDTLYGRAGNDALDGGIGIDTLNGDDGDDTLYVRSGDTANGGTGNDTFLIYEDGAAALDGGTGSDILSVQYHDITGATLTGIETLWSSGTSLTAAQLDTFTSVKGSNGTSSSTSLTLTEGGTADVDLDNATLTGGFTLTGSIQADIITFQAADVTPITAYMGGGHDVITAGIGNDTLYGQDGNDTLTGRAGNDLLDGGNGTDTLNGDDGNDTLYVRSGDTAKGGIGNDILAIYEDGAAALDGGKGTDILNAQGYDITGATLTGIETLWTSSANMTAAQLNTFTSVKGYNGTGTSASLYLTQGGTAKINLDNATLTGSFYLGGSSQADNITFNAADSTPITVQAGGGNDVINSGIGKDQLYGGTGNDTLYGWKGDDTLYGNSGIDSFVFKPLCEKDTIMDFTDGLDKMMVSGFGAAFDTYAEVRAKAAQVGSNVEITLDNPGATTDTVIVLQNFQIANLDTSDFGLISA